jgi:hypothetical protein
MFALLDPHRFVSAGWCATFWMVRIFVTASKHDFLNQYFHFLYGFTKKKPEPTSHGLTNAYVPSAFENPLTLFCA